MSLKTIFVGSSAGAAVVPGWEDYEHKMAEKVLFSAGIIQSYLNQLAVTTSSGLNLSVNTGMALVEFTNTNLTHGETYKAYVENDAAVNLVATDDATCYVILKITPGDPNEASDNLATIEVSATQPANSLTLATVVSASGSVSTITAGSLTNIHAAIILATNKGLEFSNGLAVKLKENGGLLVDSDGLQLDPDNTPLVDDTAFGSDWDGETTLAASKNALYDVVGNGFISSEVVSMSTGESSDTVTATAETNRVIINVGATQSGSTVYKDQLHLIRGAINTADTSDSIGGGGQSGVTASWNTGTNVITITKTGSATNIVISGNAYYFKNT